jgi:hypothetical protein
VQGLRFHPGKGNLVPPAVAKNHQGGSNFRF